MAHDWVCVADIRKDGIEQGFREKYQILLKIPENHNLAEEGLAIVDDGPRDPVADVGGVRTSDVENTDIVKTVTYAEEGDEIPALLSKQRVKEGAKCVYVEFKLKIIVCGCAWVASGEL